MFSPFVLDSRLWNVPLVLKWFKHYSSVVFQMVNCHSVRVIVRLVARCVTSSAHADDDDVLSDSGWRLPCCAAAWVLESIVSNDENIIDTNPNDDCKHNQITWTLWKVLQASELENLSLLAYACDSLVTQSKDHWIRQSSAWYGMTQATTVAMVTSWRVRSTDGWSVLSALQRHGSVAWQ